MARHAEWVSSPALKTLLPRLHQNASDLLADLAVARGAEGSAATATPHVADTPLAEGEGRVEATQLVAAIEGALGEVGNTMGSDNNEKASATSVDVTTASSLVEDGQVGKQLASLRNECKTLRIVIHALREKCEDSQVRTKEFAAPQMPAIFGQRVRQESHCCFMSLYSIRA